MEGLKLSFADFLDGQQAKNNPSELEAKGQQQLVGGMQSKKLNKLYGAPNGQRKHHDSFAYGHLQQTSNNTKNYDTQSNISKSIYSAPHQNVSAHDIERADPKDYNDRSMTHTQILVDGDDARGHSERDSYTAEKFKLDSYQSSGNAYIFKGQSVQRSRNPQLEERDHQDGDIGSANTYIERSDHPQ